jgi:NitT/TauT family transport system substrate-binding protein
MNTTARLAGHLAIATLMIAAVSSPALAQSAQAQSLKPWRQAIIAPKSDAGFFLMAAKRGFAEREGLKVELLEVKDDPIGMKALLSGEVDSFETTTGGIAAASRGGDVKFLGCPWHAIPYVIMARSGITKMQDLVGKTISASAPGTPPDTVARAALALSQIKESDVRFAAVGGDRDRYNALLGGVVDAAVVSNEYTPMPSSKGLNMLLEARQALPKSIRFCTLMTGKTLTERREDAIRFMTAEIKAFRYAVAHRDETIKLTREVTDAKPDDPRPAFTFDEAVKPGVVAADFPIPVENLTWMRDQLIELGQIPKGGDIAKILNADIRARALERIGK